MSKQRIDYKPTIKYTPDYQTYGKTINEQNLIIGPQNNRNPLDTLTVPSIEENLLYLPAHTFACPLCMPYQGKVYSKNGT